MQIPVHGWAQQKEHLIPINYQKTAFIDGEKVRTEYVAYTAAKEKMYKDFVANRKSYEEATHKLDQQAKDRKPQVAEKAAASRTELQNQYTAGLKQRGADRMALTKNYEQKIRLTIDSVMREGAFTGLKASKDNTTGSTGLDITDKVLQRLNQNQ